VRRPSLGLVKSVSEQTGPAWPSPLACCAIDGARNPDHRSAEGISHSRTISPVFRILELSAEQLKSLDVGKPNRIGFPQSIYDERNGFAGTGMGGIYGKPGVCGWRMLAQ